MRGIRLAGGGLSCYGMIFALGGLLRSDTRPHGQPEGRPKRCTMTTGDKIRELHDQGFCVLRKHFPKRLVDTCREAFWPVLLDYLESHGREPNRGPRRHFLPMPFEPPCFTPEFFFDGFV